MTTRRGNMKIFLIMAGGICAFMAVVFGGLYAAGLSFGDDCPYGNGDSRPGSASTNCKPRPAPTAAEARSVADGTAFAAALKTFRGRPEARTEVIAVGLNAWGDTTFTVGDEKYLTLDRTGALAEQDNAFRRNYATPAVQAGSFRADTVRPAGLVSALKRVARGRPDASFRSAVLGRSPIGTDVIWSLTYSVGRGETVGGLMLQMSREGKDLCVLGGSQKVRGVGECGVGLAPGGGFSTAPTAPSSSAAPANDIQKSIEKQVECAQKAGADAAKIQACVGG